MNVLGLSDGHDCGVAVVKDGKIVAAVNEERLNRIKLVRGLPLQSIDCVLKQAKLEPKDIDLIAVANWHAPWFPKPISLKQVQTMNVIMGPRQFLGSAAFLLGDLFNKDYFIGIQKFGENLYGQWYWKRNKKLKAWLKGHGFDCDVEFVEHHQCHAACAYFTGGLNKALVVTYDAAGDALCSTISVAENGHMERLSELGSYNSVGKYYSYVTELCGFTSNKHEGKITGLAAFGKPEYLPNFENWINYNNGRTVNYLKAKHDAALNKIKKELGNFNKANLAASVQIHLENVLSKYVSYWVDKTGISNVVLAGGVFANVKLNQRLLALPNVESIFVHPHMGDGGTALGAALNQANIKPFALNDVYFGPEFNNEEIQQAITDNGLNAKDYNDIPTEVAARIDEGKIVGLFQGRMEYGPRALGNRSIVAKPTDKGINDSLNKRLSRTEFMPFAPSILEEEAKNYFTGYENAKYPSKFMTITFDVPKEKQKMAGAVVHVDGTARPQVVCKESNKLYYQTLKAYQDASGLPLFVNTSFNAHEEPIVCSPVDAINAFKDKRVDCLVIGNFILGK
ncbi:MAG: carbamoyltransferase C-terminal domain-containing protein [archaeon]